MNKLTNISEAACMNAIFSTLANIVVFSIAVVAFALIGGCGAVDRGTSYWSGQPSEVCVSGVTYLQFTSGATVKVDREGKPVACKG